jgi:hypothetical protein
MGHLRKSPRKSSRLDNSFQSRRINLRQHTFNYTKLLITDIIMFTECILKLKGSNIFMYASLCRIWRSQPRMHCIAWQMTTNILAVLTASVVHSFHLLAFWAKLLNMWFRKICRNLWYAKTDVVIFLLLSFQRCAFSVVSCHVIHVHCVIRRTIPCLRLFAASVIHCANLLFVICYMQPYGIRLALTVKFTINYRFVLRALSLVDFL